MRRMPEDLPVVASLEDLRAVQADIEGLKVRIAALEALAGVEMPDDVKAAFALFIEWVTANV